MNVIAADLSGRRCQGGEQRGGGDSHEPPRKDHLSAHRQPSHQLPAHGTVISHLCMQPHVTCHTAGAHVSCLFTSSGESWGV